MTQQLAPERPAQAAIGTAAITPTGLVAAAAAVRGAAVAVAGLILATGLATLIWATTPTSGLDVADAMRGGVVGFAAANLMPVDIGGVTLSLPPLLFTLVITALLASTARRGRFLPEGRYQETISVLMTALVYGIIVAATTRGFGPTGAVGPQWVWTAPAIAVAATSLAMLQPGSSWHHWCVGTLPVWLRSGLRGGGVGLGVLLAGGGLAVTVGLVSHFGDAVGVSTLAAPSSMDGLGLLLVGVAYLPNAVIAAAGYVTGVGFEVGAGTYSPFGVVPVELPAVPVLAAVPDAGRVWTGLIFLVVPVAAGYLVARVAIKRLATRADRALAAGVGALLTGGLLAGAVAVARGGVGDGRWSTMGAQPLLVAAAVAVEVGVIAVLLAGLMQASTVPWRAVSPSPEVAGDRTGASTEPPADGMTARRGRRSKRPARAAADASSKSTDPDVAAGDPGTGQSAAEPTVDGNAAADPTTGQRPATGRDRSRKRRGRTRRSPANTESADAAAAVSEAVTSTTESAADAAAPDDQPESSGSPATAESAVPASAGASDSAPEINAESNNPAADSEEIADGSASTDPAGGAAHPDVTTTGRPGKND
ncbi:MAG: DUF6350 family protein [Nakamurella sp.]